MINQVIIQIVDKAVANKRLTRPEIETLFSVDEYSPEAYYMLWAARQIAWQASNGKALIYAQLGIDAQTCAGGCLYCSFAAGNNQAAASQNELPLETIINYSRAFANSGVHLISLMTTMSYAMSDLLVVVSEVRRAIGEEIVLLVNTADFGLDEALALKAAGANAAYHAIRLGEGTITSISEDCRRHTIDAIQRSGLYLMSGVEPIYAGQDANELLDRMSEVASWKQICSGLCQLRRVQGTAMAQIDLLSTARYQQLNALFRLIAGQRIAYGSHNTVWCNAGTNPRDNQMFPGAKAIAHEVASRREELLAGGWQLAPFFNGDEMLPAPQAATQATARSAPQVATQTTAQETDQVAPQYASQPAPQTTSQSTSQATLQAKFSASQQQVRMHYRDVACNAAKLNNSQAHYYSRIEQENLPDAACLASRGCGNPLAQAALQPGELVLDLGCGGGIDVLLAAKQVGESGHIYGLDMTEEMLELARQNAVQASAQNVSFIQGLIEQIPLADNSVDVVTSNCVINLSDNKIAVLHEAHRVLKAGGRFIVADIILLKPELPTAMREAAANILGCTNGVFTVEEYQQAMAKAGFIDILIDVYAPVSWQKLGVKAKKRGQLKLLEILDFNQANDALASAYIMGKRSHLHRLGALKMPENKA